MSQLLPGSILGIIGGNSQISSIILMAKRLGYRIYHFREEDEPSALLADKEVIARYSDRQALSEFAVQVDTIYVRSEEHTSELQSLRHIVCRLLLEKKKHT